MTNSLITITGLTLVAAVGSFVASVQWAAPNGLGCLPYMQPAKFEFYVSASPTFGTATKAGESTVGLYTQGGLPASATRYVWVRAVDAAGNPGAVYPSGNGQSVTTLTTQPPPNSVGPNELQNGAVTGQKIAASAVTADKMNVGSLSAITANLGNVTAGTLTAGVSYLGEVQANQIRATSLAAISATLGNVAINGNLVVNGTFTASKVAGKQFTDQQIVNKSVSDGVMTGKGGAVRGGGTLQSANINVPSGFVSIDFNALFELPTSNSSNFGYLACRLFRNGGQIATWLMYYDDNFAFPISLMHSDEPGAGFHTYTMTATNQSGAGQWTIADPVMRLMNYKV